MAESAPAIPEQSQTQHARPYARKQHDGNAKSDDNLFPPHTSAAPFINFDGRGLSINGQRKFLMSGAIHYARVPRENWRDILLKLKRCGFNCVETYVFWNFHEEIEGQFDLKTDRHDLGAFIDLAQELGLYAIIRVGPYSCAEWQNGGFPLWLAQKDGLEVRKDNAPFLAAVDRWFDRLLPIVANRQIHRGGNIILVQLENEQPTDHWRHWGTDFDGQYFHHLLDIATRHGIEVPTFFSGLHHGHDPAPAVPIVSAARKSPWMTMELWTTWFDRYGITPDDLVKGERKVWMVPAYGGNGLNVYMYHGGTTFGFFNFSNDQKFGDHHEKAGACYDFGTAIGQAGDTRDLYLRMKRLAMQAETFSNILADSDDATASYATFASGVIVTARSGPAGTLVFLDNEDHEKVVTLNTGETLRLAGGEVAALAQDLKLAEGLTLVSSSSRILSIVRQRSLTTLICFGEVGDHAKITFNAAGQLNASGAGFELNASGHTLSFSFANSTVGEAMLQFGGTSVRVLVLDKVTADQTWVVGSKVEQQIVIGAPYLGEFNLDADGHVNADVRYGWDAASPTMLTIYGDGPARQFPIHTDTPADPAVRVVFDQTAEARPATFARRPDGASPEMAEFGNPTPYAWYTARVSLATPATAIEFARLADRASFFIDGRLAATYDFKRDAGHTVPLSVPAGEHEIAVFVAHTGRRKFDGFVGDINRLESQKGLRGPVTLHLHATSVQVVGWSIAEVVGVATGDVAWTSKAPIPSAPAFSRGSFTLAVAPPGDTVLRLDPVGLSFGHVLLNGHNIGRYPEIIATCPGLWLPSCWLKAGENEIIVFDEQGCSPNRVTISIEPAASRQRATVRNPQ